MVHGSKGQGRETFGIALAVVVTLGCGGRSLSDEVDAASGGMAASGRGAGASGGSAGSFGGRSGSGALAGETSQGGDPADDSIPLDASDCGSRPQGDCSGVMTYFSSNGGFDGAPALAECSQYNSFDGCGKLIFTFDADGCANSVGPGPGGWESSGHLESLRVCLSGSLSGSRFACLASSRLYYDESCRIR